MLVSHPVGPWSWTDVITPVYYVYMGRPALADEHVKHPVPVRLTESQIRTLDEAAAVLGISRSEFMRQAVVGRAQRTARQARQMEPSGA